MFSVFLFCMKQMNFEDSKRLLRKNRIRVVDSEVAASPSHAVKIANRIGYPVVLKIDSPKIVHKTDVGGVKVNLNSASEVFNAYNEIMRKAKQVTNDINGIVVQEQAMGIEVIIGAKRDPQFGPVVLFGLGGIFVELMKDVSMKVMPFTRKDVKQMIFSEFGLIPTLEKSIKWMNKQESLTVYNVNIEYDDHNMNWIVVVYYN